MAQLGDLSEPAASRALWRVSQRGNSFAPLCIEFFGAPEKPCFLGNSQKQLDELHIKIDLPAEE